MTKETDILDNLVYEDQTPQTHGADHSILDTLLTDLPSDVSSFIDSSEIEGNNIKVQVSKVNFLAFVAGLIKTRDMDLVSFHAVDERELHGAFRLYLLFSMDQDTFLTVLTDVDPSEPSFPSITSVVYAANWYEREIKDMLGLIPEGHPDPRPLVLYDSWPEHTYPLRKDFSWNTKVPTAPSIYHFRRVEGEGVYEISVGPVHAGIIEPGHFRFSVAGEPIINLEIRLGYVHKGIEKLSEQMMYNRGVFLAERVSGDNSFAHATAYCQAVESIAGITIPDRARYIRTIFLECERLYNLFRDVAGITLVTGFNPGAQMAYSMQEEMMQLNDCMAGSRFLRGAIRLGGMHKDLTQEVCQTIVGKIDVLEHDFNIFTDMVTHMPSLLDRTQTTGVITHKIAKDLDFVGPVARASGIDRDARRDHPYAAYPDVQFDVITEQNGDVHSRYLVKMGEIHQAMRIIRQAMEKLPEGAITVDINEIPEGKVGFSIVEAPRGELMHWILSGEGKPYRHKIRDPSFNNWPAIEQAVIGYNGNIVPDFPLINKSMNLSYSGNDL
ncbi:MAG TPA: NADH-quinone oxidoreductase subunit C [Candidatus Lokiarchaeia archaeon]|nr:NADH-quinone oxidoreductase subunit C [Candidatus Lokiarchaeia archaeon]